MKRFLDFLDESAYMYHGSPSNIEDHLKPDRGHTMLDRAIGAHFAADQEVSKKFAGSLYRNNSSSREPAPKGNMYRAKAPPRSKLHVIHQQNYKDKKTGKIFGKQSDQAAIGAHVSSTVFSHPEHKELFKKWVKHARGVSDDEAEHIHSQLSSGKSPSRKQYPVAGTKNGTGSFHSYMSNFDSGLHSEPHEGFKKEVVHHYLNIMKKRGIHGLVYHNTSPNETEGVRSKKSYVIFHPEHLKIEKT